MKRDRGTIWLTFITFILICVGGFILLSVALFCTHFQCGLSMPTTITTTVVLPTGSSKVAHLILFDDVSGYYNKNGSRFQYLHIEDGRGNWHTRVFFDPTSFNQLKDRLEKLTGQKMEYQYWEDPKTHYFVGYVDGRMAIYTDVGELIWEEP